MVAEITDKALLRRHLRRALRQSGGGATFLLDHVIADLAERLAATERSFPVAVAHAVETAALAEMLRGSGKTGRVIRLDAVEPVSSTGGAPAVVGDEEALPLAPGSIDLFVSALALQWTNDLPGALIQIRRALRPDGLFVAAMTGGRTLFELRDALAAAETEIRGGVSPRVIPAADVRDVGGLLQRAGFAIPVADRDTLTVRYDSAFGLMRDLRAMGASNASPERERRPASRRFFRRAAEIYAERFADPDGRVRATFEIISLSGWAPHESQQRPARPGSGRISLADALKPPTRAG